MPYITGRVVHDADAHIMEEPPWLIDHADPDLRERLEPNVPLALSPVEGGDVNEQFRERHADPAFRAHAAEEIRRSEANTSELQALIRISYAVFCLKEKKP